MSKENITEFIVLGLLTHEDLSGYDIKKKTDQMISNFWVVGYGQLYPTLKSLQEEGFIIGQATSSTKGPERIIYSITNSGTKKLTGWLSLPEQKEYIKYEILLKIFFGSLISQGENINRIEIFKNNNLKRIELMERYKQNLQNVLSEDEDHLYFYLTVLFGEYLYKACVNWADEAINLLKQASSNNQEG